MPSQQPEPLLVLGRYQLGARIGAGAAGSVFRAVDTRTSQDVVVKFFDGEEDGFPTWASEMRLVLRFKHGNIVSCLDTGFDESHRLWVLVFELAKGGSLRRALAAKRRFTTPQMARLLIDVGSALAYAHAQGVVHRDVKPENILAKTEDEHTSWLLTDFGAGRFLGRGEVARSLAGSVEYMAPEVLHRAATAASDQFSLGVLGVELMLGRLPDPEEREVLFESLHVRSGLPGIFGRLVRSDPEQRFVDMAQVVAVLELELKKMKTGDDKLELLRPYLQKQKGLSEEALTRLTEEWNGQGSLLDFLVGKNLLSRSAARTIEAVRKGYLDVPIESVLGMTNQSLLPEPPPAPVEPTAAPAPAAPAPAPATPALVPAAPTAAPAAPTAAPAAPAPVPAAEPDKKLSSLQRPIEAAVPVAQQSPRPADAAKRRPTKPEVGMRISRYMLQESLGEGATAMVFRSFHEMLNIPVAIKVFEPIDSSSDPDAPQRFRREAQTLVRLEHPHIVRVLDVDIYEQFPFIVMEYGGEMTLATQIRNMGRLPALRIAQIGLAVADALEAASKEGLLHRDVKPSNILERRDGHIKLVDFGIAAKRMPEGGLNDPQAAQGLVSGTPSYLAPEQAQSPDRIDFRADMYALGATLYHAAVGRPTFLRSTPYDTIMAQIKEEPTAITQLEPSFDLHLAWTIHRMLRKQPQDRFSSWAEVKEALTHTLLFQDQPELMITSQPTRSGIDTETADAAPYVAPPPAEQALQVAEVPSVQPPAPAVALSTTTRTRTLALRSLWTALTRQAQQLHARWLTLPKQLQIVGGGAVLIFCLGVLIALLLGGRI